MRPEGEETLENPKQLGAEGARLHAESLRQKDRAGRIARAILCGFSELPTQSGPALFVFGCEIKSEERTHT